MSLAIAVCFGILRFSRGLIPGLRYPHVYFPFTDLSEFPCTIPSSAPSPNTSGGVSSLVAVTVVPQQNVHHGGQETFSLSTESSTLLLSGPLPGDSGSSGGDGDVGDGTEAPGTSSNNMLDRITDDLNFLLNSTEKDMMTFTPAHLYPGGGKQKLPTIQENMVGLSEELETRPTKHRHRQQQDGPADEE